MNDPRVGIQTERLDQAGTTHDPFSFHTHKDYHPSHRTLPMVVNGQEVPDISFLFERCQ
jgi:hypothetical protein